MCHLRPAIPCATIALIRFARRFAGILMSPLFSRPLVRIGSLVCLAAFLTFVTGCGSSPPPKKSTASSGKNASKPKPKPPEPKKVDPNAFSSVDEAITAIKTGQEKQDQKQVDLARDWLVWKGPSIEPTITAKLKDKNENLAIRLQCCYILAQFGTVAVGPLKQISSTADEPMQLRKHALTCMPMIKPMNKEIVDHIIFAAFTKDETIRVAGMNSLKRIGKDAKELRPDVVEKLKGVLNSLEEKDEFRELAKSALVTVDPRHGFGGMGKIEKK